MRKFYATLVALLAVMGATAQDTLRNNTGTTTLVAALITILTVMYSLKTAIP